MKLVPALAVTAVLAAVPATMGVAALATDGGNARTSLSQPASRHSSEPGDDHGGHRLRHHEAGDDHGHHAKRHRHAEAGDDNGGHANEPGDDNGGHGGDDGGHDD
jgi:hypothetical protein